MFFKQAQRSRMKRQAKSPEPSLGQHDLSGSLDMFYAPRSGKGFILSRNLASELQCRLTNFMAEMSQSKLYFYSGKKINVPLARTSNTK